MSNSQKVWGPATWYLFHSLAAKVKEEEFVSIKYGLWGIIVSVCANLPCPDCRQHALNHVTRVNKEAVLYSKNNLEKFLFDFHNTVNRRKNYKIFTAQDYGDRYKNANLNAIIQNFINIFSQNSRNNKLMTDTMQRQMFIKNFVTWMNANRSKFN